jgi:hypothetical protein
MTTKPTGIACLAGLLLALGTAAAAQTSGAAVELRPQLAAYTQLGATTRFLAYTELDKREDFPYSQWMVGAQLGFQFGPIAKAIRRDIDSDKNHHLPLAAGYEYLETDQSGTLSHENRLSLDASPGFRPFATWLVRDRNRFVFRWKNGEYSTRYRNRLGVDADFRVGDLRFAAYTSAEAFNDSSRGWYEVQYTLGLQVPYRRLLKVDAYYLRQECDTCSPDPLNVWGLTLSVFFRNGR